jgi:hypothetical protein
MEAKYRIKPDDIATDFVQALKKKFGAGEICITVTSVSEEANSKTGEPGQENHLSMEVVQEPTVDLMKNEADESRIIQVELKTRQAMDILKSLEQAKMIRIHLTSADTGESPVQYKGLFTSERAFELANEIENSRNEWKIRLTELNSLA